MQWCKIMFDFFQVTITAEVTLPQSWVGVTQRWSLLQTGWPQFSWSQSQTPTSTICLLQVWSLTQFYSVDFSKSMISVSKCVFNKRTIKVCVSCCWRCPGTSVPSTPHLTMSLYLCSSGSNARGKSRAWEGRRVSSKSPSRVRDGDEGVAGRNGREYCFPDEGSLICPPGKSMSFYKKETGKNWLSGQTWTVPGFGEEPLPQNVHGRRFRHWRGVLRKVHCQCID